MRVKIMLKIMVALNIRKMNYHFKVFSNSIYLKTITDKKTILSEINN